MEKIEKFILRILFGKEAISGYYTSPKERENKNYVFDSVFPSREAQERAINSLESD